MKKRSTKDLITPFIHIPLMSLSELPEQGFRVVHDALIGVIIGVGKQDVPVFGQRVGVDGEAVVLTGDEASSRSLVDARLVVPTVTVPKKDRRKTSLALLVFIFKR